MTASEDSRPQATSEDQLHRIVAQSDLDALEAVWKPEALDAVDENHHLPTLVNAAVWDLLLQMVRPVSDRVYAERTISDIPDDESSDNNNVMLPPDETWEAWADSSALDRVRQLRSQVRQKALSVQEKRQQVLTQVDTLLQQQQTQQQSSLPPASLPPPLGPSVPQICAEKVQQTQEQVQTLVQEIDELHVKIPDVVQRFQETLEAVQDEERQRQAERGITISPDDVIMTQMEEEENKAPAEERLFRFLTTQ